MVSLCFGEEDSMIPVSLMTYAGKLLPNGVPFSTFLGFRATEKVWIS